VSTQALFFGEVGIGSVGIKTFQITNEGDAELHLNSVLVADPGPFTVADPTSATEEPIPPGGSPAITVRFKPATVAFHTSTVTVSSDGGSVTVDLAGSVALPCIQVNPVTLQFGGQQLFGKAVLPVEVVSCGKAPLHVTGIELMDGSHPAYGLEMTDELSGGVVPPDEQRTYLVSYRPEEPSPVGDDGRYLMDHGLLRITSDAPDPTMELPISGVSVTKSCPTAIGIVQEGDEAIPQTNLHLWGDQSFTAIGAVASWKWHVEQPSGSASVFVPSDTFPNPTFEANVAGEYVFALEVGDEAGNASCIPWQQSVMVIPDEAIHIELLWSTPGDPNESDQGPEAGADVDLHVAHPLADTGLDLDGDGEPDPWFDQPYDCFWFNGHPNWADSSMTVDDDPGLDRDDTDGAGPELLNLNQPEDVTYGIGVHYWSDHGYGNSFVTLRIYIHAELVLEIAGVELTELDLWEAATIEWPSGKVTGGEQISGKYQNPNFFQP